VLRRFTTDQRDQIRMKNPDIADTSKEFSPYRWMENIKQDPEAQLLLCSGNSAIRNFNRQDRSRDQRGTGH